MPMLLLVGMVQVEKVLLVNGPETSQVSSVKAGGIFLLVLRSGLAGGSPQWQSLAGVGVAPYPILQILGSFPWAAVLTKEVSLEHQQGKSLFNSFHLLPQGWLPLGKPPCQ